MPSSLWLGSCVGVLAGWLWGTSGGSISAVASLSASPLNAKSAASGSDVHRTLADVRQQSTVAALDERRAVTPPTSSGLAGAAGSHHNEAEPQTQACPQGTRLVVGDYCTVVAHRCIEPYTDGSDRCGRFAPDAVCQPPILSLKFCIDEFEYPNRRQEKPDVMVTFAEAMRSCKASGKRLCSAREWTLACEGPDRLPYPTGRVRDATACNIDLVHRFPNVDALNRPASVARELERLDQRTPSGSLPRCVSPFGVYDMMGNVDEWVVPDGPEEAAGYGAKTALKGGYFGPVRARCRPSTPSHSPTFKFYQVGFRCCTDASAQLVSGSAR